MNQIRHSSIIDNFRPAAPNNSASYLPKTAGRTVLTIQLGKIAVSPRNGLESFILEASPAMGESQGNQFALWHYPSEAMKPLYTLSVRMGNDFTNRNLTELICALEPDFRTYSPDVQQACLYDATYNNERTETGVPGRYHGHNLMVTTEVYQKSDHTPGYSYKYSWVPQPQNAGVYTAEEAYKIMPEIFAAS